MNIKPLTLNIFKAVIALSLFLGWINSHGQGGLMRTDLISPSPTAANLGKYGDIPLNYYTGLANVSIPIFTVAGNELSLPISLTYNFNGHQPSQKASWVGLGWSLQAGGVITRSVGDKVELNTEGYDRATAGQVNPSQNYLNQSYNFSNYDNLPDMFSFNFGNYSGKFMFYNGQPYLMPYQKLKVEGSPGGGFAITTEDGTKYEFHETELTSPRPSAGSPYTIPTYISSWYLTKITNAANTESIRLTYELDGTMLQFGQKVQSYKDYITGDGFAGSEIIPPDYPSPVQDVFPTKVTVKRLASITSDKHSVIFTPGSERLDIEMESGTSKPLRTISVSSADAILKQFHLEQSYVGGALGVHSKYMMLNSLTDRGATSTETFMKHEFTYNGTIFGHGILSYVDKYGYLKGNGEMPNNTYITPDLYQYGTNRDPDITYTANGSLSRITYPTGGSTSFFYEPNRIFDGADYIQYDRTAQKSTIRENVSMTNVISSVDTFKILAAHQISITFSRTPKSVPPPEQQEVNHDNLPEVEIVRVHRNYDEEGNLISITLGNIVYSGKIVLNADNGGKTETFNIQPGTYVLRAVCDSKENEAGGFINYKEHTNIPEPGMVGPGIRVKEVIHDNGMGKTLTKRYRYEDDQGFSSGVLLRSNVFDVKEYKDVYRSVQDFGAVIWTNTFYLYTSVLAEIHGVGLPFYYKNVIEETVSPTEVHRSSHSYQYFTGTQKVEQMKKVDYVQANNNFIPMAKVENSYSGEEYIEAFGGMHVYPSEHHTFIDNGEAFADTLDIELRVSNVVWQNPVLTREIKFENGDSLIVEMTSFYDARRNLVGTRRTTSDGSTLYTKYKYPEDYSGVPSAATLMQNHMLNAVIEEQVWKKRPAGDSVMISGKINSYSGARVESIYVFESSQGITQPNTQTVSGDGKYTTLLSDSRYKKKIQFTYNSAGRVVSQQLTDHPPVSYLWGYSALAGSQSPVAGDVHPIAEIKNASTNLVFHTSFEDPSGTPMTSVTGLKAYSGSFTIPGSYTGTYKLSYWKKTGTGPWQLTEQTLTNPSAVNIPASGAFIDEVRLYPANAQMTTYTYNGKGVSTMTDVNNMVSYFEYDLMGRLKVVKDKDGNILKTYAYHVKDEVHPENVE
jgi:hypothetical protein